MLLVTNIAGNFAVGHSSQGTFILNSGVAQSTYEYAGNFAGSQGTITQNGGTNSAITSLTMGNVAGASGVYNLNLGSLNVGAMNSGYAGTGVVNQAGGTAAINGALTLANNSSGH